MVLMQLGQLRDVERDFGINQNLCARPESMISAIRSDDSGYSLIFTFRCESAFSIAETTAAKHGIVPPSPAPLTPSGFQGDGDSMC